jgi:hypothetical protein
VTDFGDGGEFHGCDSWGRHDRELGSGGTYFVCGRGGTEESQVSGVFCNLVHVVLANRFPSCL